MEFEKAQQEARREEQQAQEEQRREPDVLLGLFDYPEGFNLHLRVNLVNGGPESEGFIFTGSEGTLQIGGGAVTVSHAPHQPVPDYNIDSWAAATQQKFLSDFHQKYLAAHPGGKPDMAAESFAAPPDYDDTYDHFKTFFEAVRTRSAVVEDPVFGFRAAGAALLANLSVERRSVVGRNPEEMKVL